MRKLSAGIIGLCLVLAESVEAGYCLITDTRRDCHYSFLRDCQKAAARENGICQAEEERRGFERARMGKIEREPVPDYDPFEEGRKAAEENRRKKEAERDRAAFILELEEKSAEWDVKYPDRENPYEEELKRMGRRK